MKTVTYINDLHIFVRIDPENIYTSSDGINWNNPYTSEYSTLMSIAYTGSKIFVSKLSGIVVSEDGITWTEEIVNVRLGSIAYSETLKIFVSADSSLYISYDGLKWILINGIGQLSNVIFDKRINSFIVCSASGGKLYLSSDGVNWTEKYIGVAVPLNGLNDIPELNCFAVTGDNGLIALSKTIQTENAINNISQDSNMNFSLELGDNKLRLSKTEGNFSCSLRYRQKYIGV